MNRRLLGLLLAALALAWFGAAVAAEVPALDAEAETETEAETGEEDADSAAETETDDEGSGNSDPLQPASRWEAAGTGLTPVSPDRWQLLDAYGVQVPRGSLAPSACSIPSLGNITVRCLSIGGLGERRREDGVLATSLSSYAFHSSTPSHSA